MERRVVFNTVILLKSDPPITTAKYYNSKITFFFKTADQVLFKHVIIYNKTTCEINLTVFRHKMQLL